MKKFLNDNGLWVLFAGAVIAVALAVLSFFSNTSSPLVNLTQTLSAPFRSAYTAVAEWFSDKQNYYRDVTDLIAENEALRKELAKMEETVRQAEADREENRFLRELLDLRAQRRDLSDLETATIVEHSVSNWTDSLTLNKGTAHGVEVGDCVIDETGVLVGLVSATGVNWSTVLTVTDTDTSLGAKIFRTQELCVAEGDFALMGEGRLRLNYLSGANQLLSGDLVMTSGLGEFLPPDLVIGTVEEIRFDDAGAAAYAVLLPAVDTDTLTEVCIIKSFDIVD